MASRVHAGSPGPANWLFALGIGLVVLFFAAAPAFGDGMVSNGASISPRTASGPGGAGGFGGTPTLSVSNESLASGQSTTVGLEAGPCTPGSPIRLWTVLTQEGSTPVEVGPASPAITSDSSGGFAEVPASIPVGSTPGTYVIFATCQSSNGPAAITDDITVIPAGPGTSAGAISPPDVTWQPPATWSDPATRRVVGAAVDKSAAAAQPGADAAPAPPESPAPFSAELSRTPQRSSIDAVEIAALVALFLALSVVAMWLRRRHRPSTPDGN